MPIGSRPVLWHIMKYHAHFGHTEFILCTSRGLERFGPVKSPTSSAHQPASTGSGIAW
jgi:hypothetical protein